MPDQIFEFRNGDPIDYRQSKHILNFVNLNELKNLNILEVCKYADYLGWNSNLQCHGGGCLSQFKHALYVLIYKNRFITKLKENIDFIPNTEQTSLDRSSISKDEALKLQDLLININLKKYLKEVRYKNNLLFLGVIINTIGEEIERQNRKVTIFLCTEFRNLYPNEKEIIKELDDIYYNQRIITWSRLEIFERMIDSHNLNSLRRGRRYY
jgi:hypothetical protein